jgi:transposase-like protein
MREKWNDQYPHAMKSWEQNLGCSVLSDIQVRPAIPRKMIYTTNASESLKALQEV